MCESWGFLISGLCLIFVTRPTVECGMSKNSPTPLCFTTTTTEADPVVEHVYGVLRG